jgi:hypothetical protein
MSGNLLAWMASHRTILSNLDECMVDRYLRHQVAKQPIQLDDQLTPKQWQRVQPGHMCRPGRMAEEPAKQQESGFDNHLRR